VVSPVRAEKLLVEEPRVKRLVVRSVLALKVGNSL
jgi:hypothetical protein